MQFDICSLCFSVTVSIVRSFFFFFNDTATTEIYTLSLHDALPISKELRFLEASTILEDAIYNFTRPVKTLRVELPNPRNLADRKSTRLNSSHSQISYAVFCLKKKK